jgi:hypothetical protein
MIEQNITPPTAEEIAEIRENAYNADHPATWIWNEAAVSWVAPVDPPNDGFPYIWDETTNSWIPFPGYPRD